ncbi:hypothetical protein M752DRAFT_23301 [Aspergillus phoenicis ATCC 13157]|uniref:Uncharacterized protein n=1 Tax=Aspergillus phoenicis ATCC 13157 TaxID=1353007 RepID=A0A370PIJ6_ASPPH|nr:hypothetical protein M752DRAFT_23301 [Aspergillus phoenicis ATCC 13157]
MYPFPVHPSPACPLPLFMLRWLTASMATLTVTKLDTHRLQRLIFKSSLETVYPSAGATSIEMWLACLPLRVCWSGLSWVIYMCNTFPRVETERIARSKVDMFINSGRWPKGKRRCFINTIGASADREVDRAMKKEKQKRREKFFVV